LTKYQRFEPPKNTHEAEFRPEWHRGLILPGLDARRLPTWGFFARNVTRIDLENVRLTTAKPDCRHALMFSDVETLSVDGRHFPVLDEAAKPMFLHDVRNQRIVDTPQESALKH
jgi:hypothetical protein